MEKNEALLGIMSFISNLYFLGLHVQIFGNERGRARKGFRIDSGVALQSVYSKARFILVIPCFP